MDKIKLYGVSTLLINDLFPVYIVNLKIKITSEGNELRIIDKHHIPFVTTPRDLLHISHITVDINQHNNLIEKYVKAKIEIDSLRSAYKYSLW